MDTLTISLQLKKNKIREDGKAPVYLRITIDSQRIEHSTKMFIEPIKWDSAKQQAKGKSEEAKTFNNCLSNFNIKVQREFNLLAEKHNGQVSIYDLKDALEGKKQRVKTLIEVFEENNKLMEKEVGIKVVKKTYQRYITCLERLKVFLKEDIENYNIRLDELDYKFIKRFDIFLSTNYNCDYNMVMTYLKKLKRVIHQAIEFGYIDRDPFMSYKTSFKEANRGYLTMEEMQLLQNKKLYSTRLEEVRDVFIFACYTGISYADLKQLSKNNIQTNIDGSKVIVFERQKTGIRAVIPILREASELLEKYSIHPACVLNNMLLPVKSNQKMNEYLHELEEMCGIEKSLSMHLARHTFATTITLTNGIPLETVQKMLGHGKISTTQIYSKLVDEKVISDMNELDDFLSKRNIV